MLCNHLSLYTEIKINMVLIIYLFIVIKKTTKGDKQKKQHNRNTLQQIIKLNK